MLKIYTEDFATSVNETKSPKKEVIDNILAFSKSLEVMKTESKNKSGLNKNVELILN